MGIFGWSLPPGCTLGDIERAFGGPDICDCCRHDCEACICPECPECSDSGNPECYKSHGLTFSEAQIAGQSQRKADREQDAVCEPEAE